MKRSRYFEETLPEGYVAAYTIDAADKRTGVVLNLAGFAVMAAVGVAAWFCLRPTGFFEQYSVGRNLLFIAAILVYMVCHELLHGAAYKALTRRKLTFGLTLSVAFCGVPDVYVYRKTALLALLTPFVVCIPVFLLPAVLCADVWNRFYAALLLALHLGGCIGDLYDAWLYLFRFRDPATLMQDTGPKQTFYVKEPGDTP